MSHSLPQQNATTIPLLLKLAKWSKIRSIGHDYHTTSEEANIFM